MSDQSPPPDPMASALIVLTELVLKQNNQLRGIFWALIGLTVVTIGTAIMVDVAVYR